MCDKIEDLTQDTQTMNFIGIKAKDLNKDLDDIVRRLQIMNDVNYDKNKIDYLFNILERSLESGDQVKFILERLKALEKIHKESPSMDSALKSLAERQKLIDLTFKGEDQQINKTKKLFIDTMQNIQQQLKEVTMLQKTRPMKQWYLLHSFKKTNIYLTLMYNMVC